MRSDPTKPRSASQRRSRKTRTRDQVRGWPVFRSWLSLERLEDRTLPSGGPTVQMDKTDYYPGDTAYITGSGYGPNEIINLNIVLASGAPGTNWSTPDDAYGNFTTSVGIPSDGSWADPAANPLTLTATGQTSLLTAQTQFYDDPFITSISPTSATEGGASFTLTVNGSGFGSASVVRWNGVNLSTTFITGNQLTASVPAANIVEEGSDTVTVFFNNKTSNSKTFTVNDAPLTGSSAATASGSEGATNSSVLSGATFTDAKPGDNHAEMTATINWGDSGPTSTGVVSYSAGTYTVSGSHTYTEEGTKTINISVADVGGSTTTITGTATVADQQLTNLASANLPATGQENAAVAAITGLATFTDPAGVGVEPLGDFTATVNWGDSSTSAGTVVSLGSGNYRVDAPAHTYVEEGSYTVNVTLKHDALAALTTPNQTITIADQQLTTLASANLPATAQENVALAAITGLATFKDPAGVGVEPIGDFTATVNWGDSTTSAGTVVSLGSGNYRVDAPAHTYVDEGTYTVNVTLKHDALAAVTTPNQTIVVADQQLTSLASANLPATGQEGAALAAITGLATFKDPAGVGVEPIGDYTATVNWGDSTTSAGTVVSLGSGNYRVDAPAHTYVDEGTYTVNVTLKHDALAALTTPNQTITIADQQLTSLASANLPATGQEGAALAAITGLATFTDPAGVGVEPLGDFTATVNWGDATTSAGTVVSLGSCNYRVDAPAHTYVEEGTYTVNVTLKHDALAALTTPNQTIMIADQQLTSLASANLPATGQENVAVAAITGLATFTDPAGVGVEPIGDFTATVNWGDSTTSAGTIVSLGSGNYRMDAPAHTYVDEGTYTVNVTLKHDALAAVTTPNQTITVADQQLTSLASANLPATGQENVALAAITGLATFTDPAGVGVEPLGDFTATVNWGDSTTSTGTVVSLGSGNYRVDAPAHTYVEEGTYTVNVTLKHDALAAVTTPNQTIVVADQQLTSLASANLPATGLEGAAVAAITGLATFTDPAGIGVEPNSDFTATVNWGDSTTSTGTVVSLGSGNYRVDAPSHTYVEEGTYTVNVTLKHDALAAVTTPNQTIAIADQQLTSLASANLPATGLEGAALAAITGLATFTDPAGVGVEPLGDFTATVNWGDSTTSTGTVVSLGSGNYRVDAPSHTYVEEGTYTVNVTLKHDALPALTTPNQSIAIADQQLTSLASANLPATGLEGAAVAAITGLATFTDPAGVGVEPIGDFTATVNWGDATTSAGTVVSLGSGNYRVDAPAHTYVEEGTYTVNVALKHDALAAVTTPNQPIVVADQQLTTLASANLPATGLEGAALAAITGLATFTDPAGVGVEPIGDFTATVNWGDVTTSTGTVVSLGSGNYRVDSPSHTYVEEGTYTVNITLKHDALAAVTTPNQTIVVADQQLTNLASANLPATGQEGAAVAAITGLATFTDPAGVGVEPISDFTATVNWGDSTTSTGTVVSLGSGNYRVDAPSHAYVEEGTYTVNVTLQHDALSALTTPNQTIAIADQQLTSLASANLPATGLEGAAVAAITGLATFTDPAGVGVEPISDFTATVNWGDSTTSAGTVISLGSGNYRVDAPSHTYVEEGSYTVNVTLKHDALSALTTPNQTIAIADQQLTSLASANLPATGQEGAALGAITGLATFTDPAGIGVEPISDFTATVNWGDSTTSAGTVVSLGSGNYRVDAPSHTYVEEGSSTVNVTLKHDALPALTTPNQSIAIADQQLTSLASANLPATGVEGAAVGAITGLATFTDPAGVGVEPISDFTATVNWGDSTTSVGTVVSLGSGNYRVDAPSHTYVEEGTYTVNVTLKHDALAALTTPNQTITVADAPLTAGALTPPVATEGAPFTNVVVFHFTDADPNAVPGDYTALVNRGNGTSVTLTSTASSSGQIVANAGGGFDVQLSYTYAEEVYLQTFSVTVTDNEGGGGTGPRSSTSQSTSSFSVADAALSSTAANLTPPVATEGAPFSNVVVFHFTDADPGAVAGDFTAVVNRGNGSSVTLTSTPSANGQIVAHTGGGFDVQLSYTYAEELYLQTFSVAVTDNEGGSGTGPRSSTAQSTSSFSVADAALSSTAANLTPPVATEGAAFSNVVVFHFTDADPNAVPGDYTALVTRGDGTSVTLSSTASSNGQIVAHTGGGFDVQLSYTYAEELYLQTFSVAVTDNEGGAGAGPRSSTSQSTSSFSVADAALSSTAANLTPPVATEGAPFSNVVVFHFTDADPNAVPGDYTALVTRGDGTSVTLSSTASSNGQIVAHTGGGFDVQLSYTYAEELYLQTFSVAVTDNEGGSGTGPRSSTAQSTSSFSVADAAVSSTAANLTPPVATEGAAFSNVVVFHFTDADPGGVAGDYTAVVNRGNGSSVTLTSTPSSNGQIVANASGGFDVQLSYTYAEEVYLQTFSVTVTDSEVNNSGVGTGPRSSTAQSTSTFSVADAALSSTAANLTPPVATEGAPFSNVVVFHFTDADPGGVAGDYTAVVNRGNGSSVTLTSTPSSNGQIVANASGGFDVQLSYTYAEEVYLQTFSVTVTDSEVNNSGVGTGPRSSTSQSTSSFSVADAALSSTAANLTPPVATEGAPFSNVVVFHFTDADPNAVPDDYTALVTRGDGTSVTLSSTASSNGQIVAHTGGGFDVQLSYTYAEELYLQTFSVAVTDNEGGSGTGPRSSTSQSTSSFSVADAALSSTAANLTPPVATEGAPFSNVVVFHFTDADPNAVPGDYTALVTRGDGTSVTLSSAASANGQIVAHTGGGFDVQLSYTYAEELYLQTFSVTVTDNEGGSGTGPRSSTSQSTSSFSVADAVLTAGALTPPVATEGAPFTNVVVFHFTDADPNAVKGDYTAVVTRGDGSSSLTLSSAASSNGQIVANSGGGFDVQLSYTYIEELANQTFSVSITDNEGGSGVGPRSSTSASTSTFGVADAQLTNLASANLPASITEGGTVPATTGIATFTDPGGVGVENATGDTTATVNWGDSTTSPGTIVSLGSGNYRVNAPAHTYVEEGTYTVNVTLKHDALASVTTPNQTIVVNDASPVVGAITAPVNPQSITTTITASASFTDVGILDTHTAVWDWGDNTTSAGVVTESGGSGTVTGSHVYSTDGVFTLTLKVYDTDYSVPGVSIFQYVVIFNPAAGFVTGGGWITSPVGAYVPSPSLTGKANFGFVSKYLPGRSVPTGNTEFQFQMANFNFHSVSYDWMTIINNMAQYQGFGTINGAGAPGGGNYKFVLTGVDGEELGGTAPDTFRIRIWDPNVNPSGTGSNYIYDNFPSGNLYNDPSGTPLGGGDIQIHSSNQTAADGPGDNPGAGAPLTMGQLQPILQEAAARWLEAGATPAQVSPVLSYTFQIVALPPGILAITSPDLIQISPNAAGYGWYIDPTLADDAEFTGEAGSPAQGRMDLLSVVAHEFGHVILNMDESALPNDVMTEALPAGVRRLPTPQDLGLVPSAEWVANHEAVGLKEVAAPPVGQPAANGVQVSASTDRAASLRLLDRVFTSALGSTASLAAPLAPAPAVVTATARAEVAALPDRQLVAPIGLPYHAADAKGTAGWADSLLGDALLDELARDLAS